MICPKCGNVITHNSYFDAYYCPRCGGFIKEKPTLTNADRIRALSDEELAKWLYNFFWNGRKYIHHSSILYWLQKPAEDDHAR